METSATATAKDAPRAAKRPAPPSPEEQRRVEQQVSRRARAFDVPALLRVLRWLGWREEEVRYRSHLTTSSPGTLIHAVEFSHQPRREVLVTLNLGLLGPQSPLPSYFFRALDTSAIDSKRFVEFVGYFDHRVLRSFLKAIYPEQNRQIFADWERTKRRYLHFLDLRSQATLHWMFSQTFPELGVTVEKAALGRTVQAQALVLGSASLGGDAVFGKSAMVPVDGRQVTLTAEAETTADGRPWPAVIEDRLEGVIFPVLREIGIDLEVFLVIEAQQSWARLEGESYLGFDKVRGGSQSFRRIRVFRGHLIT